MGFLLNLDQSPRSYLSAQPGNGKIDRRMQLATFMRQYKIFLDIELQAYFGYHQC